jgi:hypothetical protein
MSLANRTASFMCAASPPLPTPPHSCVFVPSPPLHCVASHADRVASFMPSPPIPILVPIYPHPYHPCLAQFALGFCKSCIHCRRPPRVGAKGWHRRHASATRRWRGDCGWSTTRRTRWRPRSIHRWVGGSAGSRPCAPSSSIAGTDLSFGSFFLSILYVFVL